MSDGRDTAERRRTVTWSDPKALAAAGRGLRGIDHLRAMMAGDLPPPPVMTLLGITLGTVEDGVVRMQLEAAEYLYNPIGTVHGGILATILDSVMGCAVHSTLPVGRATRPSRSR
jgi:acyl-coenzyme A thioesterase PaaI-like protein